MSSINEFYHELSGLIRILDKYSVKRDDVIELLLAMSYSNKYGFIPNSTHLKLVNLFCQSSGSIQDLIHKFRHSSINDTITSIALSSDLFKISPLQFSEVICDLKDKGYAKLPVGLSSTFCNDILTYAESQEYLCVANADSKHFSYNAHGLSNLKPYTLAASVLEPCIYRSNHVKKILDDPVIRGLAEFYLRCPLMVRGVSMWHSFVSYDGKGKADLAQQFHFDLDEFRWLKVFIFLSDVTHANGPHVFIPGSHKPGIKSPELLSRGYARISDDEMSNFHPRSTWQYITCPAGTVVLADTRCWHKGTAVQSGVRSVLQPEYAPSNFSKNSI